ncbi:MAG TPA: ribonuclease P protein component [Clostridiales bacterium]|nr:ribonuclease P protein component [Clostridiales bacterium]
MTRFAVLNRNSEFRALYHRGKSQVNPALVTYARRNNQGITRVGITVGKKVGGAVQRNRCRRIIREAYRELLPKVSNGWNIVFVARKKTQFLKSTHIKGIMEEHLKNLGVLKNEKNSNSAN